MYTYIYGDRTEDPCILARITASELFASFRLLYFMASTNPAVGYVPVGYSGNWLVCKKRVAARHAIPVTIWPVRVVRHAHWLIYPTHTRLSGLVLRANGRWICAVVNGTNREILFNGRALLFASQCETPSSVFWSSQSLV